MVSEPFCEHLKFKASLVLTPKRLKVIFLVLSITFVKFVDPSRILQRQLEKEKKVTFRLKVH